MKYSALHTQIILIPSNYIVTTVHVSHGSCHAILSKDLIMWKFVLYVAPCPVTEARCEERQEICQDLILSADDDLAFLCDTITSDDIWCFSYDSQTVPKFENTSIPTEDVTRTGLKEGWCWRILLIAMVSHTMNSFSWELPYIRNNISKRYVVCENQSARSSHTWGENSWMLQHVFPSLFSRNWCVVLTHPSYSADTAPCHFLLLAQLSKTLCGCQINNTEDTKAATTEAPRSIKRCIPEMLQKSQYMLVEVH
jgi:hypothetical protein